jgi:hypothetical protein
VNEYGVGVLGSGYTITAATWTKFKVTRDYAGVFKIYVNDVLRDTTAADLTTMSTEYMALDFDAGDKIAIASRDGNYAITKYLGVV